MAIQITISWRSLRWLLAGLVTLGVLALAGYGTWELVRTRDPLGGAVDAGKVQAVILSNGVVYFGRLGVVNDDFYELRDVFFIQENQAEGEEVSRRVAPLSQELHRPDDRMLIPREQVIVIENLRPDSPVLRAIPSPSG